MKHKRDFAALKWVACVFWFAFFLQLLHSKLELKQQSSKTGEPASLAELKGAPAESTGGGALFGLMFAEAGKKKKEKSEVVVISVNNPSKGHGGGMYPMFIPTCGGHGGHGGHAGYGRRKRSADWLSLIS